MIKDVAKKWGKSIIMSKNSKQKEKSEEEIFELIRQLANEIKIIANKEKDKIMVASAEKKSYSINDDEDVLKTVEKLTTRRR